MNETLLTINEVAEWIRVPRSTIYGWIHEQRIPYCKLGRLVRFRREEILAWIDANGTFSFPPNSDKQTKPQQNGAKHGKHRCGSLTTEYNYPEKPTSGKR